MKASVSPLRLIRRREEFIPVSDIDSLPKGMRGIYVLYLHRQRTDQYDVVYVGMAASGGIRPRLRSHKRKKEGLWTHCSVFEVWDNISVAEVAELEGILRHLYRRDSHASRLSVQKTFSKMKRLPAILPTRRGAGTRTKGRGRRTRNGS